VTAGRPGTARRAAWFAVATAALLPLPAVAKPEPPAPQKVVATLHWVASLLEDAGRAVTVPWTTTAPLSVTLPPDVGDGRFARLPWGEGGTLTLVRDLAAGHDRLWIDSNLDGDLTPPLEGNGEWRVDGALSFRTDEIATPYADAKKPIGIDFRAFRRADWPAERVDVVALVHRRGTAVLGGRLRAVALVDGNADARFDDAKSDRMYVDLDGDGHLAVGDGSPEEVVLGQPFRAGDEGYYAAVDTPSGARVTFSPHAPVPDPPKRVWLRLPIPPAGLSKSPPSRSLDELRSALNDPKADADARGRVVEDIGRVGTDGAFAVLWTLAGADPDESVKRRAVLAMGNPAFLASGGAALLAMARGPDAVRSIDAIEALHAMGHPEREAVYLDRLYATDTAVVRAAALHLAYLGTEDGKKALLAAVAAPGLPQTRYAVYQAVRYLPSGPPTDVMLNAARGDDISLRALALRDLATRGDPAVRLLAVGLAAKRPVIRDNALAAIDVLGPIGDPESVAALLPLAAETDASIREAFVDALSPVRAPASVARLLPGLAAPPPEARSLVAQVLAAIPEPPVTDALVAAAKKEKDDVVAAAMFDAIADHVTAGGTKDPKLAEFLLAEVRRRKPAVRRAALRALSRIGTDVASVRSLFVGLLDDASWEDRVLALDVAAASRDPGLCTPVARSLDHRQWQVRLASAQAISTIRCPTVVPALIARLPPDVEPSLRVRDAVAGALFRITGQALMDSPVAWSTWWKQNGATFAMPEVAPEPRAEEPGGTGFFGIPVRSDRLVFVLDSSGSMLHEEPSPVPPAPGAPRAHDTRFLRAAREVLGTVSKMRDVGRVNLIFFDTKPHPWQPGLVALTPAWRSALERALLTRRPAGETNLYDALEDALDVPEVEEVFVLSDGAPDAGRIVAPDDILRAVGKINQTRRIAIHAVSLGRDSDLLQRLAQQNSGVYVRR
jgi:HEAT repeat protein